MSISVNGEVSSSVHGGRRVSVQGVSLSRGLCVGICILLECILVCYVFTFLPSKTILRNLEIFQNLQLRKIRKIPTNK